MIRCRRCRVAVAGLSCTALGRLDGLISLAPFTASVSEVLRLNALNARGGLDHSHHAGAVCRGQTVRWLDHRGEVRKAENGLNSILDVLAASRRPVRGWPVIVTVDVKSSGMSSPVAVRQTAINMPGVHLVKGNG